MRARYLFMKFMRSFALGFGVGMAVIAALTVLIAAGYCMFFI